MSQLQWHFPRAMPPLQRNQNHHIEPALRVWCFAVASSLFSEKTTTKIRVKFHEIWSTFKDHGPYLTKPIHEQGVLVDEIHAYIWQIILANIRILGFYGVHGHFACMLGSFHEVWRFSHGRSCSRVYETHLYMYVWLWSIIKIRKRVDLIRCCWVELKLTSEGLSKKYDAPYRVFCPAPPPPFHTPPNVQLEYLHGSSILRALITSFLHLVKLEPEGEDEAL